MADVPDLWTPPTGLHLKRFHERERIVTLRNGERVRVWTDDSGTVDQVEHDDSLDAVVRPTTVTVKVARVP